MLINVDLTTFMSISQRLKINLKSSNGTGGRGRNYDENIDTSMIQFIYV
jgi:hypothetical protein